MKKTLMLLCLLTCVALLRAQEMRTLFVAMPDSVAPLLTAVNRADCVDFLDSQMKAVVKNRFGTTSELKTLTADYLYMQTSDQSSMEMKLLPLDDSVKVICAVFTVCGPACDSRLAFFDTQWRELYAAEFIRFPEADAFFLPVDSLPVDSLSTQEAAAATYALARRKADMTLLKATLSPDDTDLTFVYTTPDYLGEEEREKLRPYLRQQPVVYRWTDGRFATIDHKK